MKFIDLASLQQKSGMCQALVSMPLVLSSHHHQLSECMENPKLFAYFLFLTEGQFFSNSINFKCTENELDWPCYGSLQWLHNWAHVHFVPMSRAITGQHQGSRMCPMAEAILAYSGQVISHPIDCIHWSAFFLFPPIRPYHHLACNVLRNLQVCAGFLARRLANEESVTHIKFAE